MKLFSLSPSLCPLTLALVLAGTSIVAPAFAAGKATGGGSAPTGGTAKPKDPASAGVLVPLVSPVLSYNGAVPKGSVTLVSAADGSAQSIAFNLSAINVPSGTVLPVQVIVGHLETIYTYYAFSQVVYTETDGTITINHGSATLLLDTRNGDIVPQFVAPNAFGTTEIRILSPDSSVLLLDGTVGSFHA